MVRNTSWMRDADEGRRLVRLQILDAAEVAMP
jgi:hypothetical protein